DAVQDLGDEREERDGEEDVRLGRQAGEARRGRAALSGDDGAAWILARRERWLPVGVERHRADPEVARPRRREEALRSVIGQFQRSLRADPLRECSAVTAVVR